MIPSRLARLHDAVDRNLAETVTIEPQQGGGYVPASADPDRPPAEILAYVSRTPAAIRAVSGPMDGKSAQVRGAADAIKFRTSSLAYELIAGDMVTISGASFRVSRVAPFGTGRTVAYLTPGAQ